MAAGGDQSEVLTALKNIVEDLRFRPIAEADLPVGFPPCTPVGEVEVKRYPGYRAAVTRDTAQHSGDFLLTSKRTMWP
jgi:hypothetical protein